jgi:hypothetical protein
MKLLRFVFKLPAICYPNRSMSKTDFKPKISPCHIQSLYEVFITYFHQFPFSLSPFNLTTPQTTFTESGVQLLHQKEKKHGKGVWKKVLSHT